jgi:hypothetical protein
MKKRINEEFSALRSSSPYKIRRDKGFVQDARPQMNQRYLMQKTEEINNFYERQRMAGEFDKLEPLFITLFKQITYIKEFLGTQENQPLLKKHHLKAIRNISKHLDKINKVISTDILDELDKLGAAPEQPDDMSLAEG